jgi:hypothetical protein
LLTHVQAVAKALDGMVEGGTDLWYIQELLGQWKEIEE